MTTRLCTAPSHDRAPVALGELAVCEHHFGDIADALTGPSAMQDLTLDVEWGLRSLGRVRKFPSRLEAEVQLSLARLFHRTPGHEHDPWYCGLELAVDDGSDWISPHGYRPARIARDYADLGERLAGQTTGEHIAASTNAEAPLPLDTAVADLRKAIHRTLALWQVLHVEKFNLNTAVQPGATVAQLAAFLAIHRDRAAAQEWAGDYAEELRDLRRRARKLIDLPQPRRVAIARCVETSGGVRCAGTLWLTPREERDVRPVSVSCDTCPAVYTGERWKRLSERLVAQAGRMAA